MPDKNEKFFYFVDNVKYESDLPTLTGAQIKARIANFNPAYTLTLEGHGNETDRVIVDTDVVSLEKDKGPRRLFTAPPATFGG
jgi:hypothetical protein